MCEQKISSIHHLIKMEMPDIHQRIGLLVDHFCAGNKTAFGKETDILPGVLASIIGGRMSKPSFDLLHKVLSRYPQVSGDWLISGQGSMLHKARYSGHIGRFPVKLAWGNSEAAIIAGNQYNRLNHDYVRRDESEVPSKKEEDTYALSNTSYAYESLSLPASIMKPGLHRAFPIQDSTMEPSFGKGDLIIAKQMRDVDWSAFPRESTKYDVIDTFPMCVVEVRSKKEKSIEFGRCCVDASLTTLRCFSDNRLFYPKRIDLEDINEIWEFSNFLSSRSLNPAQELVYKVAKLEYELEEAKNNAKLYTRLKHRLRELILEWNASFEGLGQTFYEFQQDEEVRKHYIAEVSQTDSEEEYALRLYSIIQPLIIELTPTLEADSAKRRLFIHKPGMPPPLSGS